MVKRILFSPHENKIQIFKPPFNPIIIITIIIIIIIMLIMMIIIIII